MLRNHGTALEADLQRFYQLDLADMYRGRISARKIAICATNLPRGSAVGQRIGGPSAISDETDSIWSVEHTLRMIHFRQNEGKGPDPKRLDYPSGVFDQQAREENVLSRAERFMKRHNAPPE